MTRHKNARPALFGRILCGLAICAVLFRYALAQQDARPATDAPDGASTAAERTTTPRRLSTGVERVESDTQWNAHRVEHGGVRLYFLVPDPVAKDNIPIEVVLYNRSSDPIRCGDSGSLLDSKVTIEAADGSAVPYSTRGAWLFEATERLGHSKLTIRPGNAHDWKYNLSDAFEPMKPGKYHLSLEANVRVWDSDAHDFSKTLTLVAKHLPFTVH